MVCGQGRSEVNFVSGQDGFVAPLYKTGKRCDDYEERFLQKFTQIQEENVNNARNIGTFAANTAIVCSAVFRTLLKFHLFMEINACLLQTTAEQMSVLGAAFTKIATATDRMATAIETMSTAITKLAESFTNK
uniref:Uncharacterized protein n=1 Tax=Timema bartmani TaxID=61472 RepID=A0A7R9EVD7_9NEOP|nr:unnamed protein product [Timema bartmani]